MKSPVLHFFDIGLRTEYEDAWRFGYSLLDKEHICIWKNGVKRKARVIDIGEKDGAICQDTTKDPVEVTGGAKALFDNWYRALVSNNNSVFDSVITKQEIISLYERLGENDE